MLLNRRNFIKTSLATSMLSYTGNIVSTVCADENNTPSDMGLDSDVLLVIDVQRCISDAYGGRELMIDFLHYHYLES